MQNDRPPKDAGAQSLKGASSTGSSAGAAAGSGGNSAGKEFGLEEIIQMANKIGLEYVDRKRDAERLELLRTAVRARIMNRLEEATAGLSENRLKRLAEADPEYIQLLESIADARADSEKLRIRYESYRNLFDARRSLISYRKTELKTL